MNAGEFSMDMVARACPVFDNLDAQALVSELRKKDSTASATESQVRQLAHT